MDNPNAKDKTKAKPDLTMSLLLPGEENLR